MTTALEQLLSLRDAPDRYDTPPEELLALQIEAVNERLEQHIDQIPLLKNRAESSGTSTVKEPADLVPLLFAHNTYKTYSEAWLLEGQWERMARWLQTVSTYDASGASFDGVDGLDAWVEALEREGRFVACSSGTTGKPAMLGAVESDLVFASLGERVVDGVGHGHRARQRHEVLRARTRHRRSPRTSGPGRRSSTRSRIPTSSGTT